MTGDGGLVEVQATAERTPLSRAHLDELLALAALGIEQLQRTQEEAISSVAAGGARRRRRRAALARRPVQLLLATHNEHKRREFERLLGGAGSAGWQIEALPQDVVLPPEDGETFAENALGQGAGGGRGERAREHRR